MGILSPIKNAMTNIIKNSLVLLAIATMLAIALFLAPATKGNPQRFSSNLGACDNVSGVSTVSTSTPVYMTAGTATTTATCYLGNDGVQEAVVQVALTASSTNTTVVVGVEESMDGVDWYPVLVPGQENATTSPVLDLDTTGTYSFQFASSSFGGGAQVATDNFDLRAFSVPVRMKQVRAFASLASTTGHLTNKNGAVWLGIVPRLEI